MPRKRDLCAELTAVERDCDARIARNETVRQVNARAYRAFLHRLWLELEVRDAGDERLRGELIGSWRMLDHQQSGAFPVRHLRDLARQTRAVLDGKNRTLQMV